MKNIKTNINLSCDYKMYEYISRTKRNGSGKKKSQSKSKSKEKNDKNENYNKCTLCKNELGKDNIMEHMKKCDMCYQCKKRKNEIRKKF